MPTREHEMWLELLRERPALAAELLDCVRSGLVPAFERAQLESADLREHAPASYYADAVVTLGNEKPALAVIVEVQLRRDRRKHLSWPAYLATARARLGLTPLVLGPEEVPVLTDQGTFPAAPELAVVSAVVHGAGPDGAKVFEMMLECMEKIEPEQAQSYIDEVFAVLPEAARDLLEAMMTTRTREYKSDFARRYFSQGQAMGEARGEAKAILTVLSARGIAVPEDVQARISECTDREQLEAWERRAATADSIDDLFD